jgi:hypothetical protein
MKAKAFECERLMEHFHEFMILTRGESTLPIYKVVGSNFFAPECAWAWETATVLYAAATCFSKKQMEALMERFSTLRLGTIVLLLDKEISYQAAICPDDRADGKEVVCGNAKALEDLQMQFPCNVLQKNDEGSRLVPAYEKLNCIRCSTSWGHAFLHVYRKVA